ncbi:6-carboxyhexanoate--CoA ligase [Neobacillus kokaensis]|uniref:6-carboxyhexanoate--CoA ligase n=1 Tax=Neobacillus kokaensis TaxID=2759023 RepID=A0ABQ3N5T1_9BACI|nr:6-carboxyhexanoate--CoA ligase [Neobacillus kokaensis]GHH99421.1 6-carboxyhexanoate--CoA ligase [Neobacillus kokaensis]
MEKFYSVRMRASKERAHEQGGKHISGGEQIAAYENVRESIIALLDKALTHTRGKPDFLQIQFDLIDEPIRKLEPLPLATNKVETVEEGRLMARNLLEKSGVPRACIEKAFLQITEFFGHRGAILFDIQSNQRVDHPNEKSVRVSRMDWPTDNFAQWADHHAVPRSKRIKEALVLATKVNRNRTTVAELCWSDDPEYITGYVASKKLGYQRITKLKEVGDEHGCRIFFIDGKRDLSSYIEYLEKQPIFIEWDPRLIDNSTALK